MNRHLIFVTFLFGLVTGFFESSARAEVGRRRPNAEKPVAVSKDTARINALHEQVQRLNAEVESLKSSKAPVAPATPEKAFKYLNLTYFKVGFGLLAPRARTFPFAADTGLGLFFGFGQYFGENHVIDLSLDWDIYPSMTLKYRYEFHRSNPNVTFSPVIGYKIRAAKMKSLDDFLAQPDDVKNSFVVLGGMVAFPLTDSIVAIELLYYLNQQAFLVGNFALHLGL